MYRVVRCTLLAATFLLVCGSAHEVRGQTTAESAETSTNLRSEVRRDINRYRWIFGGDTAVDAGAWSLRAATQYSSDALVLFDNRLSFRDELSIAAGATRPLGAASLRLGTEADWYSLSRVLSAYSRGGLRLSVGRQAWLEPQIGVALDRRPGIVQSSATPGQAPPLRSDAGPAIGWLAGWQTSTEHYRLAVDSRGDARRIEPRRDYAFVVSTTAAGRSDATRWTLDAVASSFRRDTYEAVSFLNRDTQASGLAETIEQTTSDTLGVAGSLTTPIIGRLHLIGTGGVTFNRRRVRGGQRPDDAVFFETNFDRRSVDLDLAARYEADRVDFSVGTRVGAEVEDRTLANRAELPQVQAAQKAQLLDQADADRGYYGLTSSIRVDVGRRTTLLSEGLVQLTRHDTPEVNPDDRDERSLTGLLAIRTRVSPTVALDSRLFGSRYETVYIRAERSAENNTQTSLRLQSNVEWRPSRDTHVRVGPEVRATYTVDDFELEGRAPRDQSAREFRMNGEIEHVLAEGLKVMARGSRSDLRLGRFLADTFSEIPIDTLRATTGEVRVQVGRRHTAEIGVRIFVRSDFNLGARVSHRRRDDNGNLLTDPEGVPLLFTTTRPGRDIVRQVGPVVAASWNLTGASFLRIDGWLTFQRQYQELYGSLPETDVEEIQKAAASGRRRTIPNVSMAVVWRM